MPRKVFFDFTMAGNWLGNFGNGILIPVVLAAVADEDTAEFLNFGNQVAVLHASSRAA